MSEKTSELLSTVIFFGFLSFAIYFFLLRPALVQAAARGDGGVADQATRQQEIQAGVGRHPPPTAASSAQVGRAGGSAAGGGGELEDESSALSATNTRVPPHVSTKSGKIASVGGTNLLIDGLLAFKHGGASIYVEQKQLLPKHQSGVQKCKVDAETIHTQNRKERARILSRLLLADTANNGGGSTPQPPSKGSTFVVSVPASDVECEKLQRILYLLGTYYNLLVVIGLDGSVSKDQDSNGASAPFHESLQRKDLIKKLRGTGTGDDGKMKYNIPTEVLPDHRIVAASSISGRVAFVRQVQRVELVVEYDTEVHTQLTRFGHRVIVYPSAKSDNAGTTSSLGSFLLPDSI